MVVILGSFSRLGGGEIRGKWFWGRGASGLDEPLEEGLYEVGRDRLAVLEVFVNLERRIGHQHNILVKEQLIGLSFPHHNHLHFLLFPPLSYLLQQLPASVCGTHHQPLFPFSFILAFG